MTFTMKNIFIVCSTTLSAFSLFSPDINLFRISILEIEETQIQTFKIVSGEFIEKIPDLMRETGNIFPSELLLSA